MCIFVCVCACAMANCFVAEYLVSVTSAQGHFEQTLLFRTHSADYSTLEFRFEVDAFESLVVVAHTHTHIHTHTYTRTHNL